MDIGGEYRNRTGLHGFAIRPVIQTNQQGIVSKPTLTNRELNENVSNAELTGAKENAANLAGFNGAKTSIEAAQLHEILTMPGPIIQAHWGIAA
jgi:hypothetical protein